MTSMRSGGVLVCLFVGLTACSQVLRLDEFVDAEPGAGGASGATSATSGTTATTTATSASSGGGTGGEGGATACEPGESQSCYEGPAGTADIGVCKSGTQTCLPDGSGFGSCDGQTLPGVEDCAVAGDQDCTANCEEYQWALEASGQGVTAVASAAVVASDGSVYSFISFTGGPVNFEGNVYTPSDSYFENVLFKADDRGNVLWAKHLGAGCQLASQLAVTPDDGVLISGYSAKNVDLGGGVVISNPATGGAFAAKVAATGDGVWAASFPVTGGFATGNGAVADAAGNAFVLVTYSGTIQWPPYSATSQGETDVAIIKLSPQGDFLWTAGLSGSGQDIGAGLAIGPNSGVLVAGSFSGVGYIGSGQSLSSVGKSDGFVQLVDGLGKLVWARRFGSASEYDIGVGVAVSSDGSIRVAGTVGGAVDFEGQVLGTANGPTDVVLLGLDGNGQLSSATLLGDSGTDNAIELVAQPLGGFSLSAYFQGAVDLGLGLLTAPGAAASFTAAFDGTATPYWNRVVPGEVRLALGPDGSLHLAGGLFSPLDLGGPMPLENLGAETGFLAKIGRPGL